MSTRKLKDRSIRQKLLFSYVGLIVIPLTVLSLVMYQYSISFLEARIVNSFHELNRQIVSNTDAFLETMIKISERPFYNQEVISILSKDYDIYEFPTFERNRDVKYISDSFFSEILLFNDSIDSLVIYPFNQEVVHRRGYKVIFNYDYRPYEEEWFQRIIDGAGAPVIVGLHEERQVSSSKKDVISIGRVLVDSSTYRQLGVFLINIRNEVLGKLYEGLQLGSEVEQIITDDHHTILYSTDAEKIGTLFDESQRQRLGLGGGASGAGDYFVVQMTSDFSGWEFYNVIHRDLLFQEVNRIRNFMLLAVIVLIAAAFIVAYLLARSIALPVTRLSRLMKRVEEGDFTVTVPTDAQDEIGRLGQSFNAMTRRIEQLIKQIKEEEKSKRSAELMALQTQINPHFLYNTLGVVKWMAEAQMAPNIAQALDHFIQMMISITRNMKEFVLMEEEMSFIQQYLELLQLRYFDSFSYSISVHPDVKRLQILRFIIQPFVENAIFHGFVDPSRQHHLDIRVTREHEEVEIVIQDNGIGMHEQDIQKLLNRTDKASGGMNGIGVRNVLERIQLVFGEQYGATINSIREQGTTVTIRIPAIRQAETFRRGEVEVESADRR